MKRLFTLLFSISLIQAAIANPSHQHPMPTDPKAFALMQETLTTIHAKVPAKSINIEAISKKARARQHTFRVI